MNKIILSLLIVFSISTLNTHANTLIKQNFYGYDIEVIEHDTASDSFSLKVGVDTKGGSSLNEIMKSVGGVSGVTGVFQCPKDYSACGGRNFTINERYIEGEKIGTYDSTGQRVVFGWDLDFKSFIFQTNEINKERENEIYEGLANHPLLLLDGVPMTESYWKKGLIDFKMREKGTRNFICSSKNSEKYYFGLVYLIDIDTLPIILKKLGCHNAINLDAGYSTAMIYNGGYIKGPGREILDGVFLVPKTFSAVELDLTAKKLSQGIHKKIKHLSPEKRNILLEQVQKKIELRVGRTNAQNTQDILGENSVGELSFVGTKLNYSTRFVKKIYLLNELERNLEQQILNNKKEISERENRLDIFNLKF